MNIFKQIGAGIKGTINWVTGFFSSNNENSSSRRLVGIIGAFTLFVTLYKNSNSLQARNPSETLVWAVVIVVCTALGLASVKEFGDIVNKVKGFVSKPEQTDQEKNETPQS